MELIVLYSIKQTVFCKKFYIHNIFTNFPLAENRINVIYLLFEIKIPIHGGVVAWGIGPAGHVNIVAASNTVWHGRNNETHVQ